jgi:hypothetical protein
MNTYEKLAVEIEHEPIIIIEKNFKSKAKGICKHNKIAISKQINLTSEKACILAEELGHYFTSFGNILDQRDIKNVKQEKRARNWAYERLVPLNGFIEAFCTGIRNRNELAEFLGVTEDFIDLALKHYSEKFGLYKVLDGYIIYFEPLGILKMIDV